MISTCSGWQIISYCLQVSKYYIYNWYREIYQDGFDMLIEKFRSDVYEGMIKTKRDLNLTRL
jgi:hypothetical protein